MMHFDLTHKSKILKKLLAFVLFFSFLDIPAEARPAGQGVVRQAQPRNASPARGARHARPVRGARNASPARGARHVRPVRGARNASPARGARHVRPVRGARNASPARGARHARPARHGRAAHLPVVYQQAEAALHAEIAHLNAARQQAEAAGKQAEAVRQQAEAARQQAEAVRQQAEAARQQAEAAYQRAEAARHRAEAARLAAVRHGMEHVLPTQRFVKSPRQKTITNLGGHPVVQNFSLCDLGYTGRARTEQYKDHINPNNTLNQLNLPTAPVFTPHNPTQGLGLLDQNGRILPLGPAITLTVKLPGYYPDRVSANLRAHLGDIEPQNVDMFVVFQDMAWRGVPLQLKPQGWLDPEAPTVSPVNYSKTFPVKAGVFSRQPNLCLQGQPVGGLVELNISVHNAGPNTPLVSSGNVLSLQNLDQERSQIIDTLTKYQNRAAVVRTVLFNPSDQEQVQAILHHGAVHTLTSLRVRIGNAKLVGHFATIDENEVFLNHLP